MRSACASVRLASCALVLLAAGAARAQQILIDQPLPAGAVTLYPKVRDDKTWYYAPMRPRVAQDENGNADFSFLRWVQNTDVQAAKETPREGEGGGIVHTLVTLSASPEDLREAEQVLQRAHPGAHIEGPVAFASGTFGLVSSFTDKNKELVQSLVGVGVAPVLDGAKAAVSILLTKQGAKILWDSFNMESPDISFLFEMQLDGYLSPKQVLMEAEWDRVYDHQSFRAAFAAGGQRSMLAGEINAAMEELREQRVIKVTFVGEDAKLEEYYKTAYEALLKEMFTPLVAPAAGGQTSLLDKATKAFEESRKSAETANKERDKKNEERIKKNRESTEAKANAERLEKEAADLERRASEAEERATKVESELAFAKSKAGLPPDKAKPPEPPKTPARPADKPADTKPVTSDKPADAKPADKPADAPVKPPDAGTKPVEKEKAGDKPADGAVQKRDADAPAPDYKALVAMLEVEAPKLRAMATDARKAASEGRKAANDARRKADSQSGDVRTDEEMERLEGEEASPGAQLFASYEMKQVKKTGTFRLDMNKFTSATRKLSFAENIGDLRRYRDNPAFFREVNLDDPLYRQREIAVLVNNLNAKDFGEFVNFVTVRLRKLHENGQETVEEVRVDRNNFNSEANRFRMIYGWKGDSSRDRWMRYEHKEIWSFSGGAQVETPWQTSEANAIDLSPPYQPHRITLDSDPTVLEKAGVRSITVRLYTKLGEQEYVKQVAMNPERYEFSQEVGFLLPVGSFDYEYEVSWRMRGNKTVSAPRQKSRDQMLYVDEIPEGT